MLGFFGASSSAPEIAQARVFYPLAEKFLSSFFQIKHGRRLPCFFIGFSGLSAMLKKNIQGDADDQSCDMVPA